MEPVGEHAGERAKERTGAWLSSAEAAARLHVSRATLYSYVSRGLLHPEPAAVGASSASALNGRNDAARPSRAKRYRRGEVERLARRNAVAREPRSAARAALDFGLPVLESSLCLIEDGRFYYRGVDALEFAVSGTLEDTAALLWQVDRDALCEAPRDAWPRMPAETAEGAGTPVLDSLPQRVRLRFALLISGTSWARSAFAASSASPAAARASHWPLVQVMLAAATGQVPRRARARWVPMHEQFAAACGLPASAADALRHALVLAADHELNVSSFTARCIASTGADAAAAIGGALAALSGPRHGAMSLELGALWPQIEAAARGGSARLEHWLERRLDEHKRVPGFGHMLYPHGDPRARALLDRLPADRTRDRLALAMLRRTGYAPNFDFGLFALTRHLGAPAGTTFALFAAARTVGWLAHVFEQQAQGQLIRPRAAYVGPRPQAASADASSPGRVFRWR